VLWPPSQPTLGTGPMLAGSGGGGQAEACARRPVRARALLAAPSRLKRGRIITRQDLRATSRSSGSR